MGRLTEMVDYLNRPPEKFSTKVGVYDYSHFMIDDKAKEVRRNYRAELRSVTNKTKI